MGEKAIRSICGFCHRNCGLKIYVDKGKITRVEGDPNHPVNRGSLCSKAGGIKQLVESEDRLRYPMKRTKGGWVRISWDEALRFAAERLTNIRETHGPGSLVRCGGAPVTYEGRDGFLEFMAAYGSTNTTGSGNLCHVPRQVAFNLAFGGKPDPDYENTNLIIFWGSNPLNTTRFSSFASYDGFDKIVPRAKERGVKIIVVDPMRSETVRLADDWIQPNIGTDSALGLAMIHTIIEEDLYDEAFVGQWVAGFDEIRKHVETLSPAWAERITSVPDDRGGC